MVEGKRFLGTVRAPRRDPLRDAATELTCASGWARARMIDAAVDAVSDADR